MKEEKRYDVLELQLRNILKTKKVEFVGTDYTYSMTLEDGEIFIIQRDNYENGYVDSDNFHEYFNSDYGFSVETLENCIEKCVKGKYKKVNFGYEVYDL